MVEFTGFLQSDPIWENLYLADVISSEASELPQLTAVQGSEMYSYVHFKGWIMFIDTFLFGLFASLLRLCSTYIPFVYMVIWLARLNNGNDFAFCLQFSFRLYYFCLCQSFSNTMTHRWTYASVLPKKTEMKFLNLITKHMYIVKWPRVFLYSVGIFVVYCSIYYVSFGVAWWCSV